MHNFMTVAKINKILIIGFLSFLFVPTVFGAYEISDGSIKGLWHCNSDYLDSSGNGNNGTAYGNASLSTTTMKLGNGSCYYNGGTGDYVDFTSDNYFSFQNGDFTINTWVNPTQVNTENSIWTYGTITNQRAWGLLYKNNGHLTFYYSVDGVNDPAEVYTTSSFETATWQMFTVKRTGGRIYFYKNGTLLNAGGTAFTATLFNSSGPLVSGRFMNYAGNQMKGYIDESLISVNALSDTQISALYNAGSGNEICLTTGCAETTTTSTSTSLTSEDLYNITGQFFLFTFFGIGLYLGYKTIKH